LGIPSQPEISLLSRAQPQTTFRTPTAIRTILGSRRWQPVFFPPSLDARQVRPFFLSPAPFPLCEESAAPLDSVHALRPPTPDGLFLTLVSASSGFSEMLGYVVLFASESRELSLRKTGESSFSSFEENGAIYPLFREPKAVSLRARLFLTRADGPVEGFFSPASSRASVPQMLNFSNRAKRICLDNFKAHAPSDMLKICRFPTPFDNTFSLHHKRQPLLSLITKGFPKASRLSCAFKCSPVLFLECHVLHQRFSRLVVPPTCPSSTRRSFLLPDFSGQCHPARLPRLHLPF